ncbi:glycosyltransferase family 4 protein [Phaeodactylibacter luteus]|uniref:Glycosyltransferase family 4 protein n=1 Tax=Phaeodactylibacter luteus TaxID=1564516 RepID=A0A5C6RKD9_9BACT|nr:glycosyltransferase family 4 protein [Phaeodactylibacter luteus]TXB62683.1 glycosyltransferase family 4 protein [Phaeodactylibacter luteus]
MKKILMLLEKHFPEDERVEKEALALIKAGYEVHIASMCDALDVTSGPHKGIQVHRRGIGKWHKKTSVGALKFPFYFNFWRKFVGDLCRAEQYDALHVHDLPLAQVGHEISQAFGLKYVLDLHEHWPALLVESPHTHTFLGRLLSDNDQWEAYEKRMVGLADEVIVVIEEAAERLAADGLSPERLTVVSNTISLEELTLQSRAARDAGAPFVLGYAGGIQYLRGIQWAVEAMPYILEALPNTELWLIGGGRHVPVLQEMCKGNPQLEEKVRFFGHLPYQEMMAKVNQFDIGLIPHLRNPLTDATIPNKLFQYMYLQKPIIASDCLPIKRIVEEVGSGLIHRDGDARQLAACAVHILTHPEESQAMGERGRRSVEERYNWAHDAQSLVDTYARLWG